MFQHTAARRRLPVLLPQLVLLSGVSTHSRPKAAASKAQQAQSLISAVSTHSRPKAAAAQQIVTLTAKAVSTHSRPKAAALCSYHVILKCKVSTHSRPKAAAKRNPRYLGLRLFQHTAARRRLLPI